MLNIINLSDEKVQVEVIAPPEESIALAYVKIHTSQLNHEDLFPHTTIRVLTSIVHAVAFPKQRGEGNFLRFSDNSPPGYERYIRQNGLADEILAKVDDMLIGAEEGMRL